MQRDLQNAYSRQASLEVERQVGALGTVSVGYAYLRGDGLLMAINQNVPSCVAGGHQQRLPADSRLRQQQPVLVGRRVHLSRAAGVVARSGRRAGATTAPATRCRRPRTTSASSSSAARSIRSTSRRTGAAPTTTAGTCFVFSGGVNSPMAPAHHGLAARLTHGFQLSTMLQAYSAAPFNITSGVTTVQGTAGRPVVDGEFIPRNSGVGDEFFTHEPAASAGRSASADAVRIEALAEVFNLTNTVNETARNTNFGTGAYPTNPSPTFNQVTAVGDPRSWQFALRLRF